MNNQSLLIVLIPSSILLFWVIVDIDYEHSLDLFYPQCYFYNSLLLALYHFAAIASVFRFFTISSIFHISSLRTSEPWLVVFIETGLSLQVIAFMFYTPFLSN